MFRIDAKDPTPIYAQLEWAIRGAIATGQLKIGDRLPTVRQLAVDLRVNANTVAKVFGELERAGVVETRRGVGTFVLASDASHRPGPGHFGFRRGPRDAARGAGGPWPPGPPPA